MFFVFVFAFAWICWTPGILADLGLLSLSPALSTGLFLLGGISPAVSAIIVTSRKKGGKGVKSLLKSSVSAGRQWPVWITLSLLLIGVHWSARIIFSLVTENPAPAEILDNPVGIPFYFIAIFLVGGGLGEEIGWRGFALPSLQKTFTPFASSLILSGIWIIWHLPLFFFGDTNQSLIPFWLFFLAVIPLGFLLTYIYNSTGTVFAAAFFHSLGNLAYDLFPVLPTKENKDIRGMMLITLLYSIFAAALLIIGRKTFFTKPEEVAS